jgi:hypothetical protein
MNGGGAGVALRAEQGIRGEVPRCAWGWTSLPANGERETVLRSRYVSTVKDENQSSRKE